MPSAKLERETETSVSAALIVTSFIAVVEEAASESILSAVLSMISVLIKYPFPISLL